MSHGPSSIILYASAKQVGRRHVVGLLTSSLPVYSPFTLRRIKAIHAFFLVEIDGMDTPVRTNSDIVLCRVVTSLVGVKRRRTLFVV